MEVHHHSHTARKKWSHYFWEFFMLFLAVTLGFFVENRREHYIEHQRAKVYARGMYEDLKKDSVELANMAAAGEIAVNNVDSFLTLVSSADFREIPSGKLYWYGLWGGYLRGFEPNNATYDQMKNSGSLRYFNNAELERSIGEYDQTVRSIKTLNEIDRPLYVETRKARARIFGFEYNARANTIIQTSLYESYNRAAIDSFMKINPPLLTTDKIIFNEYAELCRSRNIKQQVQNAKKALSLTVLIRSQLQKKFHLK